MESPNPFEPALAKVGRICHEIILQPFSTAATDRRHSATPSRKPFWIRILLAVALGPERVVNGNVYSLFVDYLGSKCVRRWPLTETWTDNQIAAMLTDSRLRVDDHVSVIVIEAGTAGVTRVNV